MVSIIRPHYPSVHSVNRRKKMNERDFERIRAAVDDILEGAPKFDEPINWGDLHCFDVQFGLTHGGDHVPVPGWAPDDLHLGFLDAC